MNDLASASIPRSDRCQWTMLLINHEVSFGSRRQFSVICSYIGWYFAVGGIVNPLDPAPVHRDGSSAHVAILFWYYGPSVRAWRVRSYCHFRFPALITGATVVQRHRKYRHPQTSWIKPRYYNTVQITHILLLLDGSSVPTALGGAKIEKTTPQPPRSCCPELTIAGHPLVERRSAFSYQA